MAADLTGDDIPDVAVADYSRGVVLLRGQGQGRFEAERVELDMEALSTVDKLAAADLDADGRSELVVAGSRQGVLLSFDAQERAWEIEELPVSTCCFPFGGLLAIDMEQDGWIDLASLRFGPFRVSIWPGAGQGQLGEPHDLPTLDRPVGLTAADIDSDGRLDFVVACGSANAIAVHRADEQGGFLPPEVIATMENPGSVVVCDLDSDGIMDLIAGSSGEVTVLMGTGNGSFEPALTYEVPAARIGLLCSDLDSDSLTDIAATGQAGEAISILPGAGGGRFRPRIDLPLGDEGICLIAADLDQDGIDDLGACVGRQPGSFAVLLNRGPLLLRSTVPVAASLPIPTGPQAAPAASAIALDVMRFEQPRVRIHVEHPEPAALRIVLRVPPPVWAPEAEPVELVLKEAGVEARPLMLLPDPWGEGPQPDLGPMEGFRAAGDWVLLVSDPGGEEGASRGTLVFWEVSGMTRH